jgi:hypothetical protein
MAGMMPKNGVSGVDRGRERLKGNADSADAPPIKLEETSDACTVEQGCTVNPWHETL